MIPNETLLRIKDTANSDILHVIKSLCPGLDLHRQGATYKACCPFHSEKTPSFVVTPGKQRWQCFGSCNEGGDAVKFVMKLNNCSFMEAIKTLSQITHIYIPASTAGRPGMEKVKATDGFVFEYRPLSASDLTYCGVETTDEGEIHTIQMKMQLFALKSYTLPARRGSIYTWRISEKPMYPILMFCFRNPDKTEWGVFYQPEAPEGKMLQNFGIQKSGTVFWTERIGEFIKGLRSGEVKTVNVRELVK